MKKIIVKVKEMLNNNAQFSAARDRLQDNINNQAASPIAGWTL